MQLYTNLEKNWRFFHTSSILKKEGNYALFLRYAIQKISYKKGGDYEHFAFLFTGVSGNYASSAKSNRNSITFIPDWSDLSPVEERRGYFCHLFILNTPTSSTRYFCPSRSILFLLLDRKSIYLWVLLLQNTFFVVVKWVNTKNEVKKKILLVLKR